jgi:hypothetical protein
MITNPMDEHPDRMTFTEKERVRTTAFLAPASTAMQIVLRRELLAWDQFGYRFGPASRLPSRSSTSWSRPCARWRRRPDR